MKRRPKEWFDVDDFWRETYPFMFPESRLEAAQETMEKALTLAGVRRKTTALDLCCGPGRCSIALARLGFSVTGVDRTKYLLNKARARARAAKVKVEWIQQDMRDFQRPGFYDLTVSMFTSFGYFADKDQDAVVLRNVFKSLKPGGAFVIDVAGKEIVAKIFLPASADTLPDGSLLLEQRKILDAWNGLTSHWTVIRNGKARRFMLQLNLYSGQELRDSLRDAGFINVQLYGSIDGEPYGPDSKRLVAVGHKPSR